ncbi:PFL_4669 family integrating conjugative element protein [Pseudomonas gingeri]|uniref:TIGR03761 family integrating conjugative element protein n=1 Tax=Pseudomonas gingeri TaxID=117681 RepID=A0A7Y8CMV5_9PSED|nr:TIGR03761 family integrating conjugative element protein [Pseudomonas gingeri]NWA02772.1 TIGR03761 family integrating conjugative element protein [Pseudomonas gingeri]NWA18267.1 TIGR03761 family integrating conjugative element protein [Pseudomonas gingeri]NWA58943.1 TIGR03761 family integrating conjugative element protein [Pseudomonas gingeri]NWA99522.1 TIGR03761 family integrating conjugative element protein [Pseudomonas gingeri]NWB05527.1 TIGR03761 family integrating conjugative element p
MSSFSPLEIGPLRSTMNFTLHTWHAAQVWQGRPMSEEKRRIMGLVGFLGLIGRVGRGAALDDPYSDFWMIRLHEKLQSAKVELAQIQEQLAPLMSRLPAALSVGENLSVQPVTLPLVVRSPLGFLAVYLLIDYDSIVRQLLLAHRTALIDRRTMERWISASGRVFRSLFGLARQYRFSGATRADFIVGNAVAREAAERFGELPADVLEGTRRSEFAPRIILPRIDAEARQAGG